MPMTLTPDDVKSLVGDEVYCADGEKLGKVADLYCDTASPDQCWVSVSGGFLGMKQRTVPLDGAELRGDEVWVPFTKDQIENSPELVGDDIDDRGLETLGSHYGIDWDNFHATDRESFNNALTLHDEQLEVGKRERAAGGVRLRKWVETVPTSETVQLRRETADVRVERLDQPVTDADFGNEEVDVQLTAEEPVVAKQAYARERVSLEKDVDVEQRRVDETVRKEHVEVDRDADVDGNGFGGRGI